MRKFLNKLMLKYIIRPNDKYKKKPSKKMSFIQKLKLKFLTRPVNILIPIDIPLPNENYDFVKLIFNVYDDKYDHKTILEAVKLVSIKAYMKYGFDESMFRKSISKDITSILKYDNVWLELEYEESKNLSNYICDIVDDLSPKQFYVIDRGKRYKGSLTKKKLFKHFDNGFSIPLYELVVKDNGMYLDVWYDKKEFQKVKIDCVYCSNEVEHNLTRLKAKEKGYLYNWELCVCDNCLEHI